MKQKRVRKAKRKSRFNFEKFVFTIKYTSAGDEGWEGEKCLH